MWCFTADLPGGATMVNGQKTEKGLDQDPDPIPEMKRGKGPKTDVGQGPENIGGTHGLSHTRKKARSANTNLGRIVGIINRDFVNIP